MFNPSQTIFEREPIKTKDPCQALTVPFDTSEVDKRSRLTLEQKKRNRQIKWIKDLEKNADILINEDLLDQSSFFGL